MAVKVGLQGGTLSGACPAGGGTAGPPWPGSVPLLRRFFGCLYYGALRPEAIVLRLADCELPRHDYGTQTLTRAAPRTQGMDRRQIQPGPA